MQDFERYRQFADTLAAAAAEANDSTYELLLKTAAAWRALADAEDPSLGGPDTVVDFAEAARRLRQGAA